MFLDDSITRRGFLAGTGAAVVLAGCGSGATPVPTAGPGFPRTLTHAFGATVIPAVPQRVAALGFADADNAAVLGVTPVTRGDNGYPGRIPPWFRTAVGGAAVTEVPVYRGIGYEQVAAQRPDVILAGTAQGLDREAYDRLAAIAPTVAFETTLYGDTWQQQLRLAGRALAREERAEQVVADVEGRFATAVREHPAFRGRTFTYAAAGDGGAVAVVTDIDNFILQIPRELGLVVAPALVRLAGGNAFATLSTEQLPMLDADVVVITDSNGGRAAVEAQELFRRIPAVTRGAYLAPDDDTGFALGTPSPLSIPYALERVLPDLARILV